MILHSPRTLPPQAGVGTTGVFVSAKNRCTASVFIDKEHL